MGMQKMKFQRRVTHPCMMKLAPAKFHCNFPLFHCLETFCRPFHMPSRLFFNLGLRIVVSFVDQRKFLPSLPHLFWEIFASNRQTLRFFYASLSQIFLSNRKWYAMEANRVLTSPKAGFRTFFWPDVVSERSGYFFIL
jgi:hypothetical protein